MKIAVVGIGYVGLSNAIILAKNNKVVALDIDSKRVNLVNNKKSPIVDKEIEDYLKNKKLDLIATTNEIEAFKDADYIVIATPTNYDTELNRFDTSSVESVIGKAIKINPKAWIVIKSTVGVGFTKYAKEKYHIDNILFSPEFLREGKALYDNLYPSRIIIGTPMKDELHGKKAHEFASLLKDGALKENVETLIMGSTEAEAVKLFANTYLALRISYFNELDTFAESKELDALDIIKGVSADPRIGDFYNNPSFGYGGYCLPKDTKELRSNYKDVPEDLISAIVEANLTRKNFIVEQILARVKNSSTIGIYRLTMKTGSDNLRQSAIQDVILGLKKEHDNIIIYEPSIKEDTYLGCKVVKDLDEFKKSSELIVTNRVEPSLDDVIDKVYTRDLLKRD